MLESGENYSPYIILIIIIIIKILLIGNTDGCSAPLTCTIVSARLAADSAGQGVPIPQRQNWLRSHGCSQQLHAAVREFNNRHGCSMAATMGGSAGPDDALRGRGKSSRGGRRCQGAQKLLGDFMADGPRPSSLGWGGRWEQQLCSFWKMCTLRPLCSQRGAVGWLSLAGASARTGGHAPEQEEDPGRPRAASPREDPAASSGQSRDLWTGGSNSALRLDGGPRATTLLGREKEPPWLRTTEPSAAALRPHESVTKRSGWRCLWG